MPETETQLSQADIRKGLKLVIADGLAAEVMTTFTGGAFLVALATLLGASNFQIGLLAAMPLLTNVFQLVSIWLVRRTNNRRMVAVLCAILARSPLIIVGATALLSQQFSINTLLIALFFYFLFGSIAGPAWNSWMKDLVPEAQLGAYFARRGSYTQLLNVALSLLLALLLDHIRSNLPGWERNTYLWMFVAAGVAGLLGAFFLSKVAEPRSRLTKEHVFRLLRKPLRDANFRKLLMFNCAWVFALNLATPFFTVFMLQRLQLSLLYIILLGVAGQFASVLTIRLWGIFADRYSNKTIIAIGGPLYVLCIIAWCFAGINGNFWVNMALLLGVHVFSGIAAAGVNLSLTNIGLKLAPHNDAIVYLATRNILTALFSGMAPLLGGVLADYFHQRSLILSGQWVGPALEKTVYLIQLNQYGFLFVIGGILALLSLELLISVKEKGEVAKTTVVRVLRSTVRNNLKETFIIGNIVDIHYRFWGAVRNVRKKRRQRQTLSS